MAGSQGVVSNTEKHNIGSIMIITVSGGGVCVMCRCNMHMDMVLKSKAFEIRLFEFESWLSQLPLIDYF